MGRTMTSTCSGADWRSGIKTMHAAGEEVRSRKVMLRAGGGERKSSHSRLSGAQGSAESGVGDSGGGGLKGWGSWRSEEWRKLTSEVSRPASAIAGRPWKAFSYTTMLTEDQWAKASARRDRTKKHFEWQLQRPDLKQWAQEQHDAKSKLEERYLVERKETLLAKRQDCRIALAERMRDRQALEHEAGQLKARKRDSVRQQASGASHFKRATGSVWRPSGYGQVVNSGWESPGGESLMGY